MIRIVVICLCYLFVALQALRAEVSFSVRQFTMNDGLPSNIIHYIFQDSKGFLWLCTMNGLARYDGNRFHSFHSNRPEDPTQRLSENNVYQILEDSHGFLWINANSGTISCYDPRQGRFVDFTGCGEEKQLQECSFFASNGDVWLQRRNKGLRRVRINEGERTMTSVKFDFELPKTRTYFIKEDKKGYIWVGTNHGLLRIDGDENVSQMEKDRCFSHAARVDEKIYFVTETGDIFACDTTKEAPTQLASLSTLANNIWVSAQFLTQEHWILLTNQGVFRFHLTENNVDRAPSPLAEARSGRMGYDKQQNPYIYNKTGYVYMADRLTGNTKKLQMIPNEKLGYIDRERYHFVTDQRGIVWIATYGNGLFAYSPKSDKLHHFTQQNTNGALPSDYLLYIMEDRLGDIWLSSEFSGLTRLSVTDGFSNLLPETAEDAPERANSIRTLMRTPSGSIWVGTQLGRLYQYTSPMKLQQIGSDFPTNIYSVAEDKEGQLWLATQTMGVKAGDKWYRFSTDNPQSLSGDKTLTIYNDSKNRMWIGTLDNGLNLAVPDEKGGYTFRHFLRESDEKMRIRCIYENNDGWMWVATEKGLCVFQPDSLLADPTNYQRFSHTNGRFCVNEVRTIYEDRFGQIWVGTSGAGLVLCRLSEDGKELAYTKYDMEAGFANNTAFGIVEDAAGYLWVATEYGVSRFNPGNGMVENYCFSSRPMGNVYNDNCICLTPDGKLLLGSNHGITVIAPENIPTDARTYHVVLTGLSVNGSRMKAPAYTDRIELEHNQNSLTIDFSTLSFTDDGTRYMYKLDNYDREWNAPSSLNSVSYRYLSPGKYTFRVKAESKDGGWNSEETTLDITIAPPLWLTWWAITFYVLLIVVTAYFIFRTVRKMAILRNRIHVEKQLTEFKLVFFTNISHEFRTPLTLMQGALDKIQRIGHVPQEIAAPLATMQKSNKRMMRLINQLLEFRKMQNNKLALSLEETDVVAFLREIYLMFADTAEQKKMDFDFLAFTPHYKIFIDKGYIDKVAYNLLSNAFKYTPSGGMVRMEVKMDEDTQTLSFKVTDNGVGIPLEKQAELFNRFMQSSFSRDSIGVGLHLSHELIAVHKGKLAYRPNPAGGSIFTVSLPTDASVYQKEDFLVPDSVLLKEADARKREEEVQPVEDTAQEELIIKPLNGRKVLIIEDNVDVLAYLKEEIGTYFEVQTAGDGIAGLEAARSYAPDLIICDVMMPGLDGMEVTKRFRADFETSHIPIILLTALDTDEKKLAGIEVGADAYITKPFSIKYLLMRIFRLIEQREKLREKYTNEPGMVHAAMLATDRDKEFVERLEIIMKANMSRPDFSVEEFARKMKLGRTLFYKKVKGLTGHSPVEYMRIVRMKRAAELLLADVHLTMAQVADQVGMSDQFYFSRCFKAQFGISPSVYQKGNKGEVSPEETPVSRRGKT